MKRGSDRLSNLPDSVLVEILSLLKAREVVQTCVLSKRWLKLWASVPRLNFDMDDFLTEEHPVILKKDTERFQSFVSRFLELREDCVNTDEFILSYNRFSKICPSAKGWILYALKHKPKKLHIVVAAYEENIHLREHFFTCESLEEVCLRIVDYAAYWGQNFEYKLEPIRVCLPNLRTIHLSHVFLEKESMGKILSGCPTLESLTLIQCDLAMDDILFQNLECLVIDDCDFYSNSDPETCSISAPNLEYLKFDELIDHVIKFKLKDMSKVNKARICSGYYVSGSDYLSSLSGVVDLELSFCTSELGKMLEEIPHCPTFYNLKILTLDEHCVLCQFGSVSFFLAHCPNLEKLVLSHTECEHFDEDVTLEKILEKSEMFCCERLELVNIKCGLYEDVRGVEELIRHCTKEIEGVEVVIKRKNF